MAYNKITRGYVVQTFDDTGKFVEQKFVAEDVCYYESEDESKIDAEKVQFGNGMTLDECYAPFDMMDVRKRNTSEN